MHLGEETLILPLVGRTTVLLKKKKAWHLPHVEKRFCGGDSFAFIRWKNFKKAYRFPTKLYNFKLMGKESSSFREGLPIETYKNLYFQMDDLWVR